uniref:Uncharacterized protein n=1 Tax=Gasterosteus aculeatus TaxID=69293 RepID=G3PV22_GASAC
MSSTAEPRSRFLPACFDHEAAAVVTILLGLFQVLLALPLAYSEEALPKFFILPLFLGILIVTGGSFTFANERNSSRLLLRGCACSNLVGLLGTLMAFCFYCYSLNNFSDTRISVKSFTGQATTIVPRNGWRPTSGV